jgi:hypothetical protein
MPDPVAALIVASLAMATLSIVLARLIPDEYDRARPERAPVRARAPR